MDCSVLRTLAILQVTDFVGLFFRRTYTAADMPRKRARRKWSRKNEIKYVDDRQPSGTAYGYPDGDS